MIVACDGGNSRIRRHLIPGQENYQIPVRLIGVKLNVTPEEAEPLRQLDPYFLQGTASQNDSYLYFSGRSLQFSFSLIHAHRLHIVLDAPSNDGDNSNSDQGTYSCQVIVSWPVRGGFFGSPSPIPVPDTDEGCLLLMKRFASTWADPFRSLILSIPAETEIKRLNLSDWPPPSNLRTSGSVALIGDALHPMAMCEFTSSPADKNQTALLRLV